ncbi:MAG: tetratricopeptide repeat protein [Tepidisphaeraceae bacterium]
MTDDVQLPIEQAFQIAVQHHQAGQLPQAEQLYRQILAQQPNHADALHLLGVIARQVGRSDIAVDLIRRAIALKPNDPEAHYNLGNALKDTGQLDDAIASYRRAIALQPTCAEACSNLGNALRNKGQLDQAIAACRQAVALMPGYAEAHNNLGIGLANQGQLDEAIASFRQAIALKSDYAEAYNNLGAALKDRGRTDEAIAALRQAVALKPNYPKAHSNLCVALRDRGRLDEAIAACHQAIALEPNFPEAHSNLGNVFKDKGQLDEAIAAYRQAIALKPDYAEAHSNLVCTMHFHPAADARTIAGERRRWNLQHAEPLRQFIQPHANDRSPDRRLRIGYVSPDFRGHVVGQFLLPLLAHHDKNQVEVFAYAQVAVPDAMTQRLHACTDHWRGIVGLADAQVADLIRQDRIDILVDLAMHTAHNRLLVFARKPAPIQVTYLGYCSSTGLETIDYRLSDPYLDPPDMDESVYSEQTIRLPETYWCYQPGAASPDVGPLPALERGFITFGCLNNFCKVSEPTLTAWAGLLRTVPNSQLLLHAHEGSHLQRLQERLAREGIEPTRVRFARKVPLADYFRLYQEIDIALDTFPYGGGTTTCDALWMGVPVVSLVGKTVAGRGGLSILSNLGLPELVAGSQEGYVQIAGTLAGNLPRLRELRSILRRRMEHSPLVDAPRFARNIEAAYRQMWRRWCALAV